MNDSITLTGFVATPPRHIVTSGGLPITSFRMATTQRRFDRAKNAWVDGDTNWYTITTFRQLALNAATSIKKGERVIVSGKLRIRDWANGEKTGTTIEIDADSVGHDLAWGSTLFSRTVISAPEPAADDAAVPDDDAPTTEAVTADEEQALAPTPF